MKKGIMSTERNNDKLILKYSDKTTNEFNFNDNKLLFSKVEEAIEKIDRAEKNLNKAMKKSGITAIILAIMSLIIAKIPLLAAFDGISLLFVLAAQYKLLEGGIMSMRLKDKSVSRITVADNLDDILEIIEKQTPNHLLQPLIEEMDFQNEYSEPEKTYRRMSVKLDQALELAHEISEIRGTTKNPFPPEEEIVHQKVLVKRHNTTTY